jgi:hypothetical protein
MNLEEILKDTTGFILHFGDYYIVPTEPMGFVIVDNLKGAYVNREDKDVEPKTFIYDSVEEAYQRIKNLGYFRP